MGMRHVAGEDTASPMDGTSEGPQMPLNAEVTCRASHSMRFRCMMHRSIAALPWHDD